MCSTGVWKKQQRLLKNMGAHKVMLDLLQVSYDKVSLTGTSGFDDEKKQTHGWELPKCVFVCPQNDTKMLEIIRFTHLFLQRFCMGNQENQALLHKNLSLFLTPGVRSLTLLYITLSSKVTYEFESVNRHSSYSEHTEYKNTKIHK